MTRNALDSDPTGKTTSSDDLPHPREDPVLKYCHEGKRYEVIRSESVFEIKTFDPDGPCGGIVVIDWVDRDERPLDEHERDDAGISRSELEPYLAKYGDTGAVITANLLLKHIKNLEVGEVDPWSYNDLYFDS